MKTVRELVESLQSEVCPACQGRKWEGKSVCIRCWRRLPAEIRQALYRRVGQGYEEAVGAALEALAR